MTLIQIIIISFVAFLHFYFMLLEMYFWNKPLGMKVFQLTKERADDTKALALNQGLYNGFLVAGLVWSLVTPQIGRELAFFFLGCVLVAGIVGGMSVNKKIFFIQGLPALLGILSLFL